MFLILPQLIQLHASFDINWAAILISINNLLLMLFFLGVFFYIMGQQEIINCLFL